MAQNRAAPGNSNDKNRKDIVYGSFGTIDAAAESCIRLIGQKSIDENAEYYSVVLASGNPATKKEEYYFSPPMAGTENSSAGIILLFIKGIAKPYRQVATVHTHGKYAGDCTDFPSNADCNVLGSLAPAYIATPSGNVYKIDSAKGISRIKNTLLGAWQACFHVRPVEGLNVWKTGFAYDPDDPNAWVYRY